MSTKAKRPAYLLRVGMAHKRLIISVAIGLAVMLGAARRRPITRMLIGWDIGVLIYLVAAAVVMTRCSTVAQMKSNAAAQDEGAFAILILTAAAGMASLVAIFAELAALERTDPHYGTLRRARHRHRGAVLDLHPHHLRPALRARILRRRRSTRTACGFPATASRTTGTSSISPSSSA